ncbi:hypothetical protein [Ralstonia wenshanensis]|uniref:hypothetical protein n=1 Tax=Ralstonia wenshanensis TaxID=2842456 RepID=UPI0039C5F0EE
MIVLQLAFILGTLAVQAATVGLLFAWRCEKDPIVTRYNVPSKRFNCVQCGLLWFAVVCVGGAAFLTCLITYSILVEAA